MITTLYAGLLVFVYVALSIHVIRGRFQNRLSLGDGGNPDMIRRIRAHANFAEYVPLALLMLALCEMEGVSAPVLHGLGGMLLVGRIFHAIVINKPDSIPFARQIGIGLTFTVLLTCAGLGVWSFFAQR